MMPTRQRHERPEGIFALKSAGHPIRPPVRTPVTQASTPVIGNHPVRRQLQDALKKYEKDPSLRIWITYQGMERQWHVTKVYRNAHGVCDRIMLKRFCINRAGYTAIESCFLFPDDLEIAGIEVEHA